MNRWLPIFLGVGALGLLELTTLSPLAHSLLVGLFLLYCAFVAKFFIHPGLEGLDEFEDAAIAVPQASREQNRTLNSHQRIQVATPIDLTQTHQWDVP
jgi:hypothetical protein